MPEISVIVPVFNGERYLAECIDSIISQTYTDWELILVDDGSTDSTPEICDRYSAIDARIRPIHIPNSGVSKARNTGLDNAGGKWVAFIDADDIVDALYLDTLLRKALAENADIATCDFAEIDDNGSRQPRSTYSWLDNNIESLRGFCLTEGTYVWGALIATRLFHEKGVLFPEGISINEDFHVMIRLAFLAEKIAKINQPLYLYRQNLSSAIHSFTHRKLLDQLWVLDDLNQFFNSHNVDLSQQLAYRRLANTAFMLLDRSRFDEFASLNRNSASFIMSCRWLNAKQKMIAWCLTHHLRPVASASVGLRKILGR